MFFFARHLRAQKATNTQWRRLEAQRLSFSRQVPWIEIRVLVDFYPKDSRFCGEAGVAYLISTDSATVLFDLGFNKGRTAPSPLRANLEALGLDAAALDGIFISHNHQDHVGGLRSQLLKVPDLDQLEHGCLSRTVLWAPVPLWHPEVNCMAISRPTELKPGIASTGPLPAHLYYLGLVREQALALALEGRGLVLVVGCGHPGIVEMVRYTEAVSGQKVYAVVGGLHLLATRGRDPVQKYLAANQPPWTLPRRRGVRRHIEQLKNIGVQQLAPSAHDSCDEALRLMREVYREGYLELRAGDTLRFAAPV